MGKNYGREKWVKKYKKPLSSRDVIHHINLDHRDNALSNLIKVDGVEHERFHTNLWSLIRQAFKLGFIKFDKHAREYYLSFPDNMELQTTLHEFNKDSEVVGDV